MPLLSKAFLHRNLFLRPEKPRFPSSQVAYIRPAAPLAIIDRSVFSIPMDRLFRFVKHAEEHTSELQSPCNLVCRLLLEKKKTNTNSYHEYPLCRDHVRDALHELYDH